MELGRAGRAKQTVLAPRVHEYVHPGLYYNRTKVLNTLAPSCLRGAPQGDGNKAPGERTRDPGGRFSTAGAVSDATTTTQASRSQRGRNWVEPPPETPGWDGKSRRPAAVPDQQHFRRAEGRSQAKRDQNRTPTMLLSNDVAFTSPGGEESKTQQLVKLISPSKPQSRWAIGRCNRRLSAPQGRWRRPAPGKRGPGSHS